jgi:hypothetical protein
MAKKKKTGPNKRTFRCVVACYNAAGVPDLVAYRVKCLSMEFVHGDHYMAAQEQAENDGYDTPAVVFDDKDGPDWMFAAFNWFEAPLVEVGVGLVEETAG